MSDVSRPSRPAPDWLLQWLPFLTWLPQLTPRTIRADLMAGLTGAIVVLPQGVAFATIAGMPPEYGLYAGMVPAIIAALFGSSWHLVSGPTTAASIVVFSGLSAFAEPASAEYVQLALTLTCMVGAIQLIMGLARLGTLVNFISHSVIIGFTAGAALLIASSQLKHFFGIELPRGGHFHDTLIGLYRNFDDINLWITTVGAVTLISGILVKRYLPRAPYMIVAMLIGSLVSVLFNRSFGPEVTGIVTVGALPRSLPPLSAPAFDLATIKELAPTALAVTLFALTEAVSIARSIAARSGQLVNGNQEFVGQGLSNIAGSFFSAYVATGSFNRSGLNYQSGARTPLAAISAGVLLMAVVLLVAPYAAYLPNAAMAGILLLVAWGLIDFHHIRTILGASRSDSSILIVTFLATLFLELEFAIFLGVILSLVIYLGRTSRPRIVPRVPDPRLPKRKFNTDPGLPECPQVKILRIDGSLFFGAVNHVQERLREIRDRHPEQKHLMIVATGINFIDVAGAELLAQEAEARRRMGGGLYLIRIKPGVCEPLERGPYLDAIGAENIFEGKGEAIRTVFDRLDPDICRRCTARIFNECASREPTPSDQRRRVDAQQPLFDSGT
ncbi:sulfate transporter [Thiohalobacter thiocyanaticus]|uniref:Sulfate transporter n=1 Tax=Thiohalobacter thiocyanaticus TaxID=585455 RepID=A0A1Z4VUL9_9GAMM|nr:SulP family inorganic anion transporter [Thiohalobacter thiocyanaticus]BAZ95326.1 sulfate transporter [Thiohalobacter thiocyanaticus]